MFDVMETRPKEKDTYKAAIVAIAIRLDTAEEIAMMLAQFNHETGNFKYMNELPGNSKHYFEQYEPGTKKGKDLGNTVIGDGEKFKGRGFHMITGRYNYAEATKLYNQTRLLGEAKIDLEKFPELVAARPDIAARIALLYWY